MIEKKYKLGESKDFLGTTFHRVVALVAIPSIGVSAGDLGGWVASEKNLSQTGSSWIGGEARIGGEAHISGEARIDGEAYIDGKARIDGKAYISGEARIGGKAYISGKARIDGKARIGGEAYIDGKARIFSIKIEGAQEIVLIGPIGSRNDYATFSADYVAVGCFRGTFTEFEKQVRETHSDTRYAADYLDALAFAKTKLERNNAIPQAELGV